LKRAGIRIEFRLQLVAVIVSGAVGFRDFLKAAALTLHIAQPSENICKNRIAARGGNAGQIPFLYPCAVCHTSGRINGKTVIVNVDVNLAAQNQIIPMDQRIDKRLKNAPLAVVGHLNTRIGGFLPACFHIPLNKTDTLIEQNDQAARVFRAVKCIYHTAAFIKAVPACAEQAGMPDGRIVCKQGACIGQLAVFVPHIEGIEQLFFHAVTVRAAWKKRNP